MDLIYTIGIIIFALIGAFVSGYVAKTKNEKEKLMCPLGENCDIVIHSRFSKFLGVRNEMIGISYYLLIVLFYIATFLVNIPSQIVFYVLLLTSLAFLFDLQLIFIQLIVLKKWCTTCLGSSSASFMILVMSFLGFQASFGSYLFGIHDILSWVFVFMTLVGVISSTLHARTFIRFLKDFEISPKESKRLAMFSHIGWVAIFLVFLTGLGFVLTDLYGNVVGSTKFMPILIVLGIIVVYEVVVNMFIAPKLIDVHFGDHPELDDHHHSMLRKTSFAFVAVGVISWYSLLLLTALNFYTYSSFAILGIYIILLLLAVAISMYAEYLYYKRSVLVYETVEEVIIEK